MALSLGGLVGTGGICGCCGGGEGHGCYASCGCINVPVDNLTLTDSVGGITINLVQSLGGAWIGTSTYNYPGNGTCPATTVIVDYYVTQGSCNFGVTWATSSNCPTTGPYIGGIYYGSYSGTLTGSGCTPFSRSGSPPAYEAGPNSLYGYGVITTITISGTNSDCCIALCGVDCYGDGVNQPTITLWTDATKTVAAWTGTGDGNGCVLRSDIPTGTYIVTVTADGYSTYTGVVTLACLDTKTFTLGNVTAHTWHFTGCNGIDLVGVTLTITGLGAFTSGYDGKVKLNLDTGSYPWTATRSRFTDASGTASVTSCVDHTVEVPMTIASGYHCFHPSCAVPAPDTLHLTDPDNGAVTLTYNSTDLVWEGNHTVNFAAYCGSPAATGVDIRYRLGATYGSGNQYAYIAPQLLGGYPNSGGGYFSLALTGTNVLTSCEPLIYQFTSLDCDCQGGTVCLNGAEWSLWPGTGGGTTFTVTE